MKNRSIALPSLPTSDTSHIFRPQSLCTATTRPPRWLLLLSIASICLLSATWAQASVVDYSYDALGRLSKVVYNGNMTATIVYTYDETGNWASVTTTRASP